MNDFPEEMNISGDKLVLDKTRLLLNFREPKTIHDISAVLENSHFIIEERHTDNEKHISASRQPIGDINHTNKDFWIRTRNSQEYDTAMVSKLIQAFGNELNWIGPVYFRLDDNTLEGRFCLLPDILIIKYKKTFAESEVEYSTFLENLNKLGLREKLELSKYMGNYHEFVIDDVSNKNAYEIKSELEKSNELVDVVLLDTIPLIVPISLSPNDTLFDQQWNMTRIRAGGKFTSAWDFSIGSNDVVICILDSGCDLTHPDLQGQYATQGVRLDTMMGDGSPITPPVTSNTNIAHGTACAGIAAASFNNSVGIAGMAGKCSILPLAFVRWSAAELTRGINFASSNDADIISMSFRFNSLTLPQQILVNDAIQDASNNGLLMCAATGNANMNSVDFPASNPLVMAVGATDQDDNRKTPTSPDGEPWGSNFGAQVSVVAPGVLIPTSDIQGMDGFDTGDFTTTFNGTSSATPQVAGLAGLIWSLFPSLTSTQVRTRIERNADKVGTVPYATTTGHSNGTWNNEMGYGRINALKALVRKEDLWIAWKGSGNDNLNVMNVNTPDKKIVLDETSDLSPALTAFRDSFWIAWKGSGNDNLNIMDVFNPNTKIVLDETSDKSPAITVFHDQLWIAWKGSGNDNLNIMDVFNPVSKVVLNETTDEAPTLTRNADILMLGWKGSGNDNLNVMQVIPPGSKKVLNETSDNGPAMSRFASSFWIAWKGSGNDNLNAMDIFVPNSKFTLAETSSHGPAVASFSNRLMIAWKGSGNDNLNVMDSNDPSTKIVLVETSDYAPSIAHFMSTP